MTTGAIRKVITRALRLFLGLSVIAIAAVGCQSVRNSASPELVLKNPTALRLATYNVHYIIANRTSGKWSATDWETRKSPLDQTVKALDADIVAFQEMESFAGGNEDSNNLARAWLLEQNPEFAASAIGDWREFPSTQPVFFREDRLKVLDEGWFFFSETPDAIYSRTFNGSYPAFASWVQFRDLRTKAIFRVINIHLDYSSSENRTRSTALIAARTKPWFENDETIFLLGDLNARLGSSLHKQLETAGFTFLEIQGSTYHFDRGINLFGAIDHIAYHGTAMPIPPTMVLQKKLGDRWPTDHYPVIADFDLEGSN